MRSPRGSVGWASPRWGLLIETEVLEILARLEADGAPGWDLHFLARPGIAADAALPGLHLEDAEPPQLDPLPAHHGVLHRVEHGLDRDLGLELGDVDGLRDLVDDVPLDHCLISAARPEATRIMEMDLLLSATYYRTSAKTESNLAEPRPLEVPTH